MLRFPIIVGIDPGLHGAIACYDHTQNAVIDARIIPTVTQNRNGKPRKILDIANLLDVVRQVANTYPHVDVWLERVGAHRMHGRAQGGSSMFSFGETNGAIKTALLAAGLPFNLVTPGSWKKALGLSQDKDEALTKATELMSSSALHWTPKRLVRTKQDCIGVAEAALIAFYAAKYRLIPQVSQAA